MAFRESPLHRYQSFLLRFFWRWELVLIVAMLQPVFAQDPESISDGATEEQALFGSIPSIYTASRHEQPVTQAPSSVSIVTDDDIKKFGYRTLADIIASLKGMYGSYDRSYNRVGIRGFNRPGDYNNRLLVMVDGHRTNDNIVDYSAVGTDFFLDVDDISRVEVVRGPASSLYGSNAFFGVINVITKRGRDLQAAAFTGEAGNLDTYKGKFTYGNKFSNGIETYFSGSHYRSDGLQNITVGDLGVAHNVDSLQNERGFGKISYGDFTLSGGYVDRDKQLPIPVGGTTLNDNRTSYIDRHGYVDFLYEHTFTDNTNLVAKLYYDIITFDGSYGYLPNTLTKDKFDGQWWGAEFHLTKELYGHQFTGGLEYRDNFQQHMLSYETSPSLTYADINKQRENWAIYLQDEYQLFDQLRLNLGIRYDKFNFTDGRFNPRAALIYQPWNDTTLKLIYGQAFRVPNVFELEYTFPNVRASNTDLQPETIETYELVMSKQLTAELDASISPYYYRANKLIELHTPSDGGLSSYQNGSPISSYGIEFEINGRWQDGWSSRFSYSLQRTEDDSALNQAVNSPSHMVKLNTIAPLWNDKVFAGLEVQYTSRRSTLQGNTVNGFFMVNTTLFSKQLLKGLELSGTVYNLLDQRYEDPSTAELALDSIEQNGRTFRIKLNYEF